MTNKAYTFIEAIKWLQDNSNHKKDGVFLNIYTNDKIYRHKGYLAFNDDYNFNLCFDFYGAVEGFFTLPLWNLYIE